MTKLLFSVTIVTILLVCSNNDVIAGRRISLENLSLELTKIDYQDLGIIIWDQREQTVRKAQPEHFLGYQRSLAQIAWPFFIKSNQTLSELMSKKIQDAYSDKGCNVNIIKTTAIESLASVMQKITNYKHSKILMIKLNKLHFEGTGKVEYYIDIELQLFNNNGDLLFSKAYTDFIKGLGTPANSSFKKKKFPNALKNVFETNLNDTGLIKNINETNIKDNFSEKDFIVTKKGEELEVKVIEIGENLIKYKLTVHLDGPVRTINKDDVFMIKYSNGAKEVFN